ncbi:PEP/pyruvate-binding domain-containing protein [Escherichia coli]
MYEICRIKRISTMLPSLRKRCANPPVDYRHPFQPELENAIREAYAQLSADDAKTPLLRCASATAEDMPDASFAGQQETFLNVQGFDASWQ